MLRKKGEWVLIPVKVETKERLDKDRAKGNKIQSYGSLINELINQSEQLSITKIQRG